MVIVGCAGIPAAYGGFETLAENLVLHRERRGLSVDLTVICSGRGAGAGNPHSFHGTRLRYLPLSANGISSIAYDVFSLAMAVWSRADAVLVLGVSGAIALPIVRCLGRVRVVTNIDGIEWRRAKWGRLARGFLRFSEWLAVRFSHLVVADNPGVAEHVERCYGVHCAVIAYGGDHAIDTEGRPYPAVLPERYALALCRIEPENNVEMILEAFSRGSWLPLVFVGNWTASAFGRDIRTRYRDCKHLVLLDPEYDQALLKTLRSGASLYVHGHSAGGTNPSLVEMMHFGVAVVAFDCVFNRYTTHNMALYFADAGQLTDVVARLSATDAQHIGACMRDIAVRHFTWNQIGEEYFRVLTAVTTGAEPDGE